MTEVYWKLFCVSYSQLAQLVQWFSHFVAKTKDFVAKLKDFVVKTKDFWQKRRIFYFFFVFAKKSFIFATLFAMFTLHTNEGSTYTEHVQTY